MMNPPLQTGALRARFRREGVDAASLGEDPIAAFQRWHADWGATVPFDPALMTLATVDSLGRPTVRAMDLVTVDHGFVFLSHEASPKGLDLRARPHAALCFVWPEVGRQVRVAGPVETIVGKEADAAFKMLPQSIRLVANATQQSKVIDNRQAIENLTSLAQEKICDCGPDRPASWLGYRIVPHEIEFWQQRPKDLHDRIVFKRENQSRNWLIMRLSP